MSDRISALNLNSASRFLILHGANTSDHFCTPSLQVLNIEQALNQHLRNQGFDRVLFFSQSKKIHFWDIESRDRFLPTPVNQQQRSRPLLKSGPLGRVALLPTVERIEQPTQQNNGVSRMRDVQCISSFESAMRDTQYRSALVFSHAEELQSFEPRKEFLDRVVQWSRLTPNNRNLCVLIFHHECVEDLREFCDRHGFSYFSTLLNSESCVQKIAAPSATEIENLIHWYRLAQGKQVDWSDLESLKESADLCDKPLKDWCPILDSESLISTAAIGRSGWTTASPAQQTETLDDLLAELDAHVGLDSVKKAIKDIVYIEIANQKLGRGSNKTRHMMFLGNPGTGKTTIARLIGRIFKAIGLLKKGHFVEASRESLVDGYVGKTAIKTTKVVESALDGVLFIDEAYALARGGKEDFGKEAIDTLVPAMENHRDRLIVVLTGYSKEMQQFIDANSGIDSRIPQRYQITFPDYGPSELVEIFLGFCKKDDWVCSDEVKAALLNHFEQMDRGKNFGNGRVVRNLFEQMEDNLMIRVGRNGLSGEDCFVFKIEDIPNYV